MWLFFCFVFPLTALKQTLDLWEYHADKIANVLLSGGFMRQRHNFIIQLHVSGWFLNQISKDCSCRYNEYHYYRNTLLCKYKLNRMEKNTSIY